MKREIFSTKFISLRSKTIKLLLWFWMGMFPRSTLIVFQMIPGDRLPGINNNNCRARSKRRRKMFKENLLRAKKIIALVVVNGSGEREYYLVKDIPSLGLFKGDYIGTLSHSIGPRGDSRGIFARCCGTNPLVEMHISVIGECCYFPSPWYMGKQIKNDRDFNPFPLSR
ncbi:MAG TPA: hypothetical protein VK255_02315 [Patescibacteria group bacterium]|nr:hypothetical protein [Patescibacteria group bacterium]